ncbi:MAG: peptide deformylase [Candidatus Omnitrophica bacterium]|nr:peptide deformylase [Candidatus Omnitrophota bacterium]
MRQREGQHHKSLSLVKYPARGLLKRTKRVETVTDSLRDTMRTMVTTMYSNQGIGLAATQVGIDLQIVVVDAGDGILKMINPVIVKRDGTDVMDEGCLSVPQTVVRIKRAKVVTVEYLDEWGKRMCKTFEGLTARAIQHEIDHLNGRLIIDYLPWYKKMITIRHLRYV